MIYEGFRIILDGSGLNPDLFRQQLAVKDHLQFMRSQPDGYIMGVTIVDWSGVRYSFTLVRNKRSIRVYQHREDDEHV